jgi:3-deoxy-manno-octulosonate cytidylyltransferase (CMP-KDO synthetase)
MGIRVHTSGSKKVLGVIPARLDSKRLPRKVLQEIAGKPMVYWVYERARRAVALHGLLVATDSDEVRQACETENIPVTMTGVHPSGSDRLFEVMTRTDGDIYVNIQGDEPMMDPGDLDLLVRPFLDSDARVTTLKVAIDAAAARDPNIVKVVTDVSGRALYFSRSPIPCDRDASGLARYYKHLGIYAYTREALTLFHRLPQSVLETTERLEQLRFLENGIPIVVLETTHDSIGVDTESDLERVRALSEWQVPGVSERSGDSE